MLELDFIVSIISQNFTDAFSLANLLPTALIALAALIAGFIDAIAGGGGLITLPVLALAGLDPASAIATNKLGSVCGSGSASFTFIRAGKLDLKTAWPYAVLSGTGAIIGSLLLPLVPVATAKVFLPFLLIGVALWFSFAPKMSDNDAKSRLTPLVFLCTIVPLIGFYDGVFGPGTGSFFMAGFVFLQGFGVVRATGCSKLANFASNLASLVTLMLVGHVHYGIGIIMGVAQLIGARFGAKAAIAKGAKLVRPLLILTCSLMAVKLLMG